MQAEKVIKVLQNECLWQCGRKSEYLKGNLRRHQGEHAKTLVRRVRLHLLVVHLCSVSTRSAANDCFDK